MHHDFVARVFPVLLNSLWFLTGSTSYSSSCITLSNGVSQIILSDSDVHITRNLQKLCPVETETLIIVGKTEVQHVLSSEFFDTFLLPNLRVLQFNVHSLKFIGQNFYSGITSKINEINLSNCSISQIPFGLFRPLKDMTSLDLSRNNISELPPDLLLFSRTIKFVNLSENKMHFLPYLKFDADIVTVDILHNPIECHCVNSWLIPRLNFVGLPTCSPWPTLCDPTPVIRFMGDFASVKGFNTTPVLATQSLILTCEASSVLPVRLYWISPIGIIPPTSNLSVFNLTYTLPPLLTPTSVHMSQSNTSSTVRITNIRGHLSGYWICVAQSEVDIVVSNPLQIEVKASMYYVHVYQISLWCGYGGMLVLLLIGIIGGTIRYCTETHCLRRPQPPFAYGGKTFIGVIPVPEVDDERFTEKLGKTNVTYDIAETSIRYISAKPVCSICSRPPTYWFCSTCKTVHFVESFVNLIDLKIAEEKLPTGLLTDEGEIKLDESVPVTTRNTLMNFQNVSDAQQPLMNSPVSKSNHFDFSSVDAKSVADCTRSESIFVRSGDCVIKVTRDFDNTPSFQDETGIFRAKTIADAICMHSKPRPNSADVKLVVSDERLAEEYRSALEDLALAVASPDPARFREHLEEFRNRLRRDVGHGVKILRGEFQCLRARSARSVASLRSQSSAAAHKVRSGISHGVEQVRGSMRSMAELCGAAGTIGQTISVVSVYVDETDQLKKERLISDFVF